MNIRLGRTLRSWLDTWKFKPADDSVRQPNTAGTRSKLTGPQRQALFTLSESYGYQVLLDVMEMACIENDTNLINADGTDPELVLNLHRMSKARWQIFVAIQKKVEYERGEYLGQQQKQDEEADEPSDEELDTEILES